MTYCLDTWAVLAWLVDRGSAAARVDAVLTERPFMNWINVGEVAYIVHRRFGEAQSRDVVGELRRALTLDLPNAQRVLGAARIKALHPLAYADAFAVATALAHDAVLMTGDPEILSADPSWRTQDLR